MKTQNNTTLTYIAPEIKTVSVSTSSHILQVSGISYNGGNGSDNGGTGYDME